MTRSLSGRPAFQASPLLLVLLTTAFALSGCVSAQLSYDGSGDGVDSIEQECDGEGTLRIETDVKSGNVIIGVEDADGEDVAGGIHSGKTDTEEEVTGAAGAWEIGAVRSQGFEGSYSVTLDC